MTDEINTGNSEPEPNSVDNITPADFINGRSQQQADQNVEQVEVEDVGTESTDVQTEASNTDVLSNMDLDSMSDAELKEVSQKLGTRAVARYGELTARRKQAEEKLSKMEKEIQELRQERKERIPVVKNNPLAEIVDPNKLIEQRDSAQEVVEWAEDILFESEDYGAEDVVTEVNGKEYTKTELRKTLKKSRDMLNKYVPAQMQELQKRQNLAKNADAFQRKALQEFPWMKNANNNTAKKYKAMVSDKRLQSLQQSNPELSAQMPYILAHAANSMYNRKPIGTNTNTGITPPRTVQSNAARPARGTSTHVAKQQEVGQKYKNSGQTDDFIALRTLQLSQQ